MEKLNYYAYCTGLGKLLLAYLKEDELNYYFERIKLKRYTSNTITRQEKLKQELILIRQQGYAFDNEEYILGVCCLAAAVRNYTNQVCAALSMAIPSVRLKNNEISFIARDVINTANSISYQKRDELVDNKS